MRILVTGAASGIGRATCLRLARDARAQGQPAKLAAVDIKLSPALESLADELRKLDAEVLALAADMASPDAPAKAVNDAVSRFGYSEVHRRSFRPPTLFDRLGPATPEVAEGRFDRID